MTMNTSASGLGAGRRALTRLPFLAGPLLRFNLADELGKVRNQDSWRRNSGRSSKTLVKHPDLHIVLIPRISIHLLQGRMRIQLPDQRGEIGAGELFALDYGISHDVEALDESAFLTTFSYPQKACLGSSSLAWSDDSTLVKFTFL